MTAAPCYVMAAPLCAAGARVETLRARLQLSAATAFFGALGLFLKLERRDSIETMATNGESLIYAAPFVHEQPDAELTGVIVHEIFHVSLRHHTRRAGRDPEQWNIACDLAINPLVLAAGFKLPADVLLDSRFAGMGAEEIYAARAAEARKQREKQKQADAAGNGAPADAAAADAAAACAAILEVRQHAIRGAGCRLGQRFP
jgi:predicted metal-dependent peptidase